MRLFFFILLFLTSLVQYGQTISGRVQSQDKEVLPFAAVTLNRVQDSSLVKAVITNEDGTFVIRNIPGSEYLLNISNIGYLDYQQTILFDGS
ncbi:MAG: carboxypeptidase-like regulatory domain-containing protein, partial [Muriicola sp.]|nr:carboxypeptidase-like regulatory domain-containing protein [Muriicola sp.]